MSPSNFDGNTIETAAYSAAIDLAEQEWYNRDNKHGFIGAIMIEQIYDENEQRQIARHILEGLTDWFGIPEAREDYIEKSAGQLFFAAIEDSTPIGFLYLKETGKDTVELYVMGVSKEYHRHGVGRALFEAAKASALKSGYSFIQVKTVQMGKYEEYDRTNQFYISMGFKEFEVFPTLWDEWNPCQIYVMALR